MLVANALIHSKFECGKSEADPFQPEAVRPKARRERPLIENLRGQLFGLQSQLFYLTRFALDNF